MGRGHADDALGIFTEHLTGEIFGYAFSVTGDEQVCCNAVSSLPRVRDGNQYALFTVCTFYVNPEAYSGV